MINTDPKRTPTFVDVRQPRLLLPDDAAGAPRQAPIQVCVDPAFAWNHGDIQQEIGNTWVGFVGPGRPANNGDRLDDLDRPHERAPDDPVARRAQGRLRRRTATCSSQALKNNALAAGAARASDDRRSSSRRDEQLNASFGQFAEVTLAASTKALESNDANDATYTSIEGQIASLTDAARRAREHDQAGAERRRVQRRQHHRTPRRTQWITQANALIAQAAALPTLTTTCKSLGWGGPRALPNTCSGIRCRHEPRVWCRSSACCWSQRSGGSGVVGAQAAVCGLGAPARVRVLPGARRATRSANLSRTHGLPEPPILALAAATAADRSAKGVGGRRRAPPPRPRRPATTARRPRRRRTRRRTTRRRGRRARHRQDRRLDDLRRVAARKLEAVSVAGGTPKLVGTLDLGSNGYDAQLLLRGNRLIVDLAAGAAIRAAARRRSGARRPSSAARRTSPTAPRRSSPRSTSRDPTAMKVTQTLTRRRQLRRRPPGRLERAHRHLVGAARDRRCPRSQSATDGLGADAAVHGRAHRAPLRPAGRRVQRHPPAGRLLRARDALDRHARLRQGPRRSRTPTSLMADAQIVYGSPTSLYVATQKWINPCLSVGAGAGRPDDGDRQVRRLRPRHDDLRRERRGAGLPAEPVLDVGVRRQYLRVASTSRPIWWGGGANGTIAAEPELRHRARSRRTACSRRSARSPASGRASRSPPCASSTTPATSSRSARSTRCTRSTSARRRRRRWRASSSSPATRPTCIRVGDGLLLGVGTDVSSDNEPSGSQLELFDVSRPGGAEAAREDARSARAPRRRCTSDHHAFLYWPPTNLAVLPVQIYPVGTSRPRRRRWRRRVRRRCAVPTPPSRSPARSATSSRRSGISELGRVVAGRDQRLDAARSSARSSSAAGSSRSRRPASCPRPSTRSSGRRSSRSRHNRSRASRVRDGEHHAVTELVMPEVVDDEFKEHYQELIRSSLLRVVGERRSSPASADAARRAHDEPRSPACGREPSAACRRPPPEPAAPEAADPTRAPGLDAREQEPPAGPQSRPRPRRPPSSPA